MEVGLKDTCMVDSDTCTVYILILLYYVVNVDVNFHF